MTIFLLIRHGSTDALGRSVSGRLPGVFLNEQGRREAEALAQRLHTLPIAAIHSSPLERTRQTAEPLARRLGIPIEVSAALNEVDYGEWTGRTFDELNRIPEWRTYNLQRMTRRPPGGEMLAEVQVRMVSEILRLEQAFAGELVAIFSHGDPIKALIAYHAGIPLDFFRRIEISPASVSGLAFRDDEVHLLCLNTTGDVPLSRFE